MANNGRDSTTNTFRVTVLPVNDAPMLTAVPALTIGEGTLLMITNFATDVDLPQDVLTFSVLNPPAGSVIDVSSGVLTWMPSEIQGPSTNRITVVVRDAGSPSLSATNDFAVTVLEVNSPPVLSAPGDRMVHDGAVLDFTISATDPDIPPNQLTYSLEAGPPAANLHPITGLFSWLAQAAQIPGTNTVTAVVTDDGVPPLQSAQTFSIVVAARPRIESVSLSGINLIIRWTAIPGGRYAVEFNNSLDQESWVDLPDDVVASESTATKNAAFDSAGRKFYRVRVLH
jgi:DNA gyrase inhibitor GyrI